MRFTFTHSHAFPGGIVVVESDEGSGPGCLVEFADGVTVEAEWWRDGEDFRVDVPSYRTAKGTVIGRHRWRISRREDGAWRSDREP